MWLEGVSKLLNGSVSRSWKGTPGVGIHCLVQGRSGKGGGLSLAWFSFLGLLLKNESAVHFLLCLPCFSVGGGCVESKL